MKLSLALTLVAGATSAAAFAPVSTRWGASRTALSEATLEYDAILEAGSGVDAAEFKAKLAANKEKMAEKDKTSKSLSKEDLKVVHEDEHIVVIDKPSGVLSVPGRIGHPSMQGAVFDAFGCESGNPGKMICHRLGMDTSGLMVFARTDAALRDLNTQFRTRKVVRKYEALVSGEVADDSGSIELPLMMDYENPPYMCVSTEERQRALIGLDAEDVGKKVLENEKNSVTEYEVVGKEDGKTRLSLTSVTGRTHQLNVHCAAIGHPIVGDTVYGDAAADGDVCVHAKSLSFRHPATREELSFESSASF
jgi:tRNA pseudouridine32 synthase/23S rRNA pseudouridine746 synthase|uniref:Pseudouridine synthase RsuA/RluA-like domain-containing protein n=2 Tax=Odontella aurita TaxID=265563 RepID=A0A7S4IC09_9STRA|mmetsp:Transcript_22885/g.67567  ORF Transcript_22885/g.67567 Transcript_22885/m.67567 type:complete len:307 (+) Transcript_22885:302-1222(+)